ncbi:carbon-nitrogen hydrolase family protein [Marinobacterium sediminicola]|uniref:Nitrilase n=1 Tax=Marinobacterium sediminicola TaxID=518898 RepID=A0ABY1RYT9_9GAMM|nr:carbon-nitrogen hydrolase family protein [Marinobacterium sediminicola]ULG68012.1 carbon-nitrogen hydrolase family protein [Marinobacterium sediminicola]SMR73478.1 nitrilase [Marinobacterium sediminicola]
MASSIKVAIVQKPPVWLDLPATLAAATESLQEAANQGAQLVMFPEAYLTGYPTWIWRLKPGGDMALGNQLHSRLRQNAVDLAHGDLDSFREAVKTSGTVVVIGMHELDSHYSGTTLFNSVAVIDSDGKLLNVHRKLMPTNPERMVWGMGDASGLKVVDTAVGRIGCLICWESYMPLARFALYAQNIELYLAPTWDSGETWRASMNHIAREGGCYVLSTATAVQGSDLPESFPERDRLFTPDEWINPGDAVVIKPFGGVIAGPLHQEKAILYADIDLEEARAARKALDVSGHYNRPDLFKLEVNRQVIPPVHFNDDPG